nr:hypothetical protein [uncultured Flavobacterium sp.]
MKIVPTFATQNKTEGLFAIHFDNEENDELEKCVENWFDTAYLYNFFNDNINDLNSGYYGKPVSIPQAIKFTRQEAEILFQALEDLALQGADNNFKNLSAIFQPLRNEEYGTVDLQKVKAKTNIEKKWLRIYAIKISPNTFIITGGAIKLVRAMQDNYQLLQEKQKLDHIKEFLQEEGIFDQEDFEVYILKL